MYCTSKPVAVDRLFCHAHSAMKLLAELKTLKWRYSVNKHTCTCNVKSVNFCINVIIMDNGKEKRVCVFVGVEDCKCHQLCSQSENLHFFLFFKYLK